MRQSQDLGLESEHRRYVMTDSDGKQCRGRESGFGMRNENGARSLSEVDDSAGGGGKGVLDGRSTHTHTT
jgi:hypothetical protein